ncbi:MAG: GntR family transcriptional regulator [Alphaproteobacteria bacterium]
METRYATLSKQLTKRIGTGEYRVGHYLPSEKQLASEFGVSRPTVRRALEYIEAIGLISRRRGDGTKVLAEKPFTDYRYTTRPVDDILYGRGAERIVTAQNETVCDDVLAARLGAAPGSRWVHISQHRNDRDTGEMLVWGDVYIDQQFNSIAGRIADYEGFICDLIEEEYGIAVSEIQQTIRPVIIPDTICAKMKMPNQSLGLEMTRRYLNHLKQTVEVSINIFPEGRSVYSITLSRAQERAKVR